MNRRYRILAGLLLGAVAAGTGAAYAIQRSMKGERAYLAEQAAAPELEESGSEEGFESEGSVTMSNSHFQVAGLTDLGKRRANNQDSFKMGKVSLANQDLVLAVVCDGMGGHAGGEVASQIATDLIWNLVSKHQSDDPKGLYQAMAQALERADSAIEQRASKDPDLRGMGTTAVLAAIGRDSYIHCHLGDSRLYHVRNGKVIYQTKDHSVVRFLVEEGIITSAEAKDHPYRSQLTSSLGGGPNANRLTIEPKWDDTGTPHREWKTGDWLLLCSDGLNSELEDDEICSILERSSSPKEASEALRGKVLETDARDNVTMVVALKK
ncbi:MAG: protein phosphatase 2C domain-containing protein [Vulcanimicrobiota bacterium]